MSAHEMRHEMDYRNVSLRLQCLNIHGNLYLAPASPHMTFIHIIWPRNQVFHSVKSPHWWKKNPNGMSSNPPWIINQWRIMDYGISLGISCFGKVFSRATCSLQACKYDSVSSGPPNSFVVFWQPFCSAAHSFLSGRMGMLCQHAAVHAYTMCVPCGGRHSKNEAVGLTLCHLEIVNHLLHLLLAASSDTNV